MEHDFSVSHEILRDNASDFERLELLIRRANDSAHERGAASRLLRLMDTGDPSVIELERIIVSDPGLLTAFLRAAQSLKLRGVAERAFTSVRDSILLLGFRSVRTLALSLVLHTVSVRNMKGESVDIGRFARHSMFVANFAKYLAVRHGQDTDAKETWTDEEVFGAGMLHDIGLSAVSQHAPNLARQLHIYATRRKVTYAEAFAEIHQRSLFHFGAIAIEAWGLPEVMLAAVRFLEDPTGTKDAGFGLLAVAYSDHVATRHGYAVESWEVAPTLLPEIELAVALPEEELEIVVPRIGEIVESYFSEG